MFKFTLSLLAVICLGGIYSLYAQPIQHKYLSSGDYGNINLTKSSTHYYNVTLHRDPSDTTNKNMLHVFKVDPLTKNVIKEQIIEIEDYHLIHYDIQFDEVNDLVFICGKTYSVDPPTTDHGFILILNETALGFTVNNYKEIRETSVLYSMNVIPIAAVPEVIAVGQSFNEEAYVGKFDIFLNGSYWHHTYKQNPESPSNAILYEVVRVTDNYLSGSDPETLVAIGRTPTLIGEISSHDVLLLKFESDGTFLLEKIFDNIDRGISEFDDGRSLAFDNSGGLANTLLYALGTTTETNTYPLISQFIMKLDINFNIIWQKKYPRTGCFLHDMHNAITAPLKMVLKDSQLSPDGILVSAGVHWSFDIANCLCDPPPPGLNISVGYVFRHDENTGNPLDIRIFRNHHPVSQITDLETSLSDPDQVIATDVFNFFIEDDDLIFNNTGCGKLLDDIYSVEDINFVQNDIEKNNLRIRPISSTLNVNNQRITKIIDCAYQCTPKIGNLFADQDVYELAAYPTIVENKITIDANPGIKNFDVYSIEGIKVLENLRVTNNEVSIDNIEMGTYFLVGQYEEKTLVFKFIKK